MIYIISALYTEAKFFIEKFNLKKNNSLNEFQIFENEKIKLIISGVGKVKSAVTLTYLATKFQIKENDFIFNIGFCASLDKNRNLADIILMSKIENSYNTKKFYSDMLYKHKFFEGTISSYDKIIENSEEIADHYIDMEASGFFEAANFFFKRDKIVVLKIVSDILYKDKNLRKMLDISKDVEQLNLSFEKISNWLLNFLDFFEESDNFFLEQELEIINKTRENFRLSDTMMYEFFNILRYLKLSNKNIVEILKEYEKIEVKTKLEGKIYFENFKKRFIK